MRISTIYKNGNDANLQIVAKEIASKLEITYNYYSTVYFDIIVEAVENTLKDFGCEIKPLSEIHKHIKENYI